MMWGDARGQAGTETILVVVFVIAGLIAMLVYVQRGIQGNLFSATSGLGAQFDPRDPWAENETMAQTDTVVQVVRGGTVGAPMLDGHLGGMPNQNSLPDLPAGPVHREPSVFQETAMTSNWLSTHAANYCNDRTGVGCP